MTKRIFRTILVVAVCVFAASAFLFMSVLYEYFSSVQQNQMRAQLDFASQGVINEGIDYFKGLGENEYRITWIDTDGSVLYDTASDAGGMENHFQREEVKEALTDGYGESSRYSDTLTEKYLYNAKRLRDGTILRLSITQKSLLRLTLGMIYPICIILVIAIILSVLLASRLSKKIVKPLNELNLDAPLNNEGYEELKPLLRRIDIQQKQIKETEQIRQEFTANVSHELKTPLQTISGYAELLSNGIVKDEDVPGFSKQIYTESQRMISLVDDIIKLSHLDEGADDMNRESVDLFAAAEEVKKALESKAEKVGLEFKLRGENANVYGVPQLLESIIYNLCDNAIKYNRKGGKVSVNVTKTPDAVRLSVADTGIGIPKEQQERIFERFYRVDKSHSKAIGGTGLGLSIVKHAVLLHDADIEVKSELDKGTEIVVKFPRNK